MDETPAVGIGGGAAVNPYKEYPLAEHHRQVLAEMIHRDKNHPCVVLWSLGNEPDLEHFPQDAYDYWHPLYELAHQLDPQNRPVTLVCCQNDYTKDITTRTMDIVCINRYYAGTTFPATWTLPAMAESGNGFLGRAAQARDDERVRRRHRAVAHRRSRDVQ